MTCDDLNSIFSSCHLPWPTDSEPNEANGVTQFVSQKPGSRQKVNRPDFTGTLPFLYHFSFLAAKAPVDGHHLRTATILQGQ
jgi:hypothetical protein